ncbi:MAG: GcrA family cell cycle regulator [Pseudomonadota bacterium]
MYHPFRVNLLRYFVAYVCLIHCAPQSNPIPPFCGKRVHLLCCEQSKIIDTQERRYIISSEPNTDDLIPMEDLTSRKCAWPVGNPQDDDFGFCGNKSHHDDTPYCEFHTKMAFRDNYVSKREQFKLDKLKKAAVK